jgi:hypothetical protein
MWIAKAHETIEAALAPLGVAFLVGKPHYVDGGPPKCPLKIMWPIMPDRPLFDLVYIYGTYDKIIFQPYAFLATIIFPNNSHLALVA